MAWRVLFGEVKSADNDKFKAFKKMWTRIDLLKINTLTIDPSCDHAPWLSECRDKSLGLIRHILERKAEYLPRDDYR